MRKITAAFVAAIFAMLSFGAYAAPVSGQAAKPQSTYELIAKKSKTYKKAAKRKKTAVKAKKGKGAKKGGKRAGRCGVGKYYKKGKCASAADKK
jgi:hypothetical protein